MRKSALLFIMFFAASFYACSNKSSIPSTAIPEALLPFDTNLKIESTHDKANVFDRITYKATVVLKDRLPSINPHGTLKFYANDVLLCDATTINADTLDAECSANFINPGMYKVRAEYQESSVYYNSSKSIDYYQKVTVKKIDPISFIYRINDNGQFSYSANGGTQWLNPQSAPVDYSNQKLTSVLVDPVGNIVVKSDTGNVYISTDFTRTWTHLNNIPLQIAQQLQDVPKEYTAPVLFAVSSANVSGSRAIKYSVDSGHTWMTMDDVLPFDYHQVSFKTFSVNASTGVFYSIYEGPQSEQLLTSNDSGKTWHLDDFVISSQNNAAALLVDDSQAQNEGELQILIGHANGWVTNYNTLNPNKIKEFKVCYERGSVKGECQISALTQSSIPGYWPVFLSTSVSQAAGTLTYVGSPTFLYITPNSVPFLAWEQLGNTPYDKALPTFASHHSVAYNWDQQVFYESINTQQNNFNGSSGNQIVIRENFDVNNRGTLTPFPGYPQEYSNDAMIPLNLYFSNDKVLYVSFVTSKQLEADKNAKIYVTTDNGNTWVTFAAQPFDEKEAASFIFTKYI